MARGADPPAQSDDTVSPVAKSTVVTNWYCDGSAWCRCAAKMSSWYVAPSVRPSYMQYG